MSSLPHTNVVGTETSGCRRELAVVHGGVPAQARPPSRRRGRRSRRRPRRRARARRRRRPGAAPAAPSRVSTFAAVSGSLRKKVHVRRLLALRVDRRGSRSMQRLRVRHRQRGERLHQPGMARGELPPDHRAPVVADDVRRAPAERVEQVGGVGHEPSRWCTPRPPPGARPRSSRAGRPPRPQPGGGQRGDHPRPRQRGLRPAVQQQHGLAVLGPGHDRVEHEVAVVGVVAGAAGHFRWARGRD